MSVAMNGILAAVQAVTAILALLIPSASFCQSSTTVAGERARIKAIIEQSIANGISPGAEKSAEDLKVLSRESFPILIEFGLNRNLPHEFRAHAFGLLKQVADERILEPLIRYLDQCVYAIDHPCEVSLLIGETMAAYYRKTKDERALQPYMQILQNDRRDGLFGSYKLGAIMMLIQCQDLQTAGILKEQVIDNSSYPWPGHQARAAAALAEMGDDTVLPDLIEYANFLLEPEIKGIPGRATGTTGMEGVRGLAILARTNDSANRALQKLALAFATDYGRPYAFREEAFDIFGESIIPALGRVGRPENVRLIEDLLIAAKNTRLELHMIRVLSEVGDAATVLFLENLDKYREESAKAAALLRKKLSKKPRIEAPQTRRPFPPRLQS